MNTTTGTDIISENQVTQELHRLSDVVTERAALCAIMLCPSLIVEAERDLTPDCFYFDLDNYIFRIMVWVARHCRERNITPAFDAAAMLSYATELGPDVAEAFCAKTDGMQQVRSIEAMKVHIDPSQFPIYARVLLDLKARRDLYLRSRSTQIALFDRATPAAEIVATHGRDVSEIATTGLGTAPAEFGSEADAFDLRRRLAGRLPRVRLSRFPSLMNLMKGRALAPDSLTVIVARTKVGKSYFLLNSALDVATQGLPVLYLDTEMTQSEQYDRAIACLSGVHEHAVGDDPDALTPEQRAAIEDAKQRIGAASFKYQRIAGRSPDFIRNTIQQFRDSVVGTMDVTDPVTGKVHRFTRPALVCYDWLRLPDAGGLKHAQEYQLLGAQTAALKQASADCGIPILAAAQMNRDALDATADDFKNNPERFVSGSDRIAHFCSCMAILRNVTDPEAVEIAGAWPARENRNDTNRLTFNQLLHVTLNRHGGICREGLPVYFDRGYARMYDAGAITDKEGRTVSQWLATPKRVRRAESKGGGGKLGEGNPPVTDGVSM